MACVWLLGKCHGLVLSPPADMGWLREREMLLCTSLRKEKLELFKMQWSIALPHPKNAIGNNSFAFPVLCENEVLREMQCQMGIVC